MHYIALHFISFRTPIHSRPRHYRYQSSKNVHSSSHEQGANGLGKLHPRNAQLISRGGLGGAADSWFAQTIDAVMLIYDLPSSLPALGSPVHGDVPCS